LEKKIKNKIDLFMRNKIEKLLTGIIALALIASFSIGSLSLGVISASVNDSSFSVSSLSTQDIFWPGNSSEWTEVAPETQGIDPDKIDEMFEAIENNSWDIHSIIIARNGYLLLEEYLWESQIYRNLDGSKSYYNYETLHMQQSTTKSIMSILIGIALQQGFLDNVSQTLYEFFAHRWNVNWTDSEKKKDITIEQLLTHNSGLVGDGPLYPPGAKTKIQEDCIKWALKLPLIFNPGKTGEFEYSNDGCNLLSGIIANVTGKSAEEFAKEYLFTPLGISEDEYNWWHDDLNVSFGGYGIDCTPKVQAKLGILCLNNGTWDGTQIVDPNFMDDAVTFKINAGWIEYGYLFYILLDGAFEGYFTYGAGGQCIYVIPEYNIVVGFTGSDLWMEYHGLIVSYILQFVDIPENGPEIPGFDFNLILLTIFFISAVVIIRRKKSSEMKRK
jgi:hypothetical protein